MKCYIIVIHLAKIRKQEEVGVYRVRVRVSLFVEGGETHGHGVS